MIAASLKDAGGDQILELLLRKGAEVSVKSNSGQVSHPRTFMDNFFLGI